MITDILNIAGFAKSIIDKFFPDKTEVLKAQAEIDKLAANGELATIAGQYKLLETEAASKDKWTSRGRPSVIYVTLFFIVLAIPFGVFYARYPVIAEKIITGMQLWFRAIPNILYECMGGIIGLYSLCRTYEKVKGVSK